MSLPVRLEEFIQELEFLTDQSSAYINKMTGEIVAATHDEWRMIEDEDLDVDDLPKWQQPLIERIEP